MAEMKTEFTQKFKQIIIGLLMNGNAAVDSSIIDVDETAGNKLLLPSTQLASLPNTPRPSDTMSYCFWWDRNMPTN